MSRWKVRQIALPTLALLILLEIVMWNRISPSQDETYALGIAPLIEQLRLIKVADYEKPRFFDGSLSSVCARLSPRIAVVVVSDLQHFSRRKTIRDIWAKNYGVYQHQRKTVVVFAVGKSDNATAMRLLRAENATYNDMLILNFEEKYTNLVYKVWGIFEWMNVTCPSAQFVVKVDDDVVLHVPSLEYAASNWFNEPLAIYGSRRRGPVDRAPHLKHYMTREQYAPSMWPWYADGPCYIFPRETVPRLLDIAKVVRTIPTDDVFFGGVLAEVAGFPRIHVKQIAIEYPNPWQFLSESPCVPDGSPRYIAFNGFVERVHVKAMYNWMDSGACTAMKSFVLT